MKVFLTGATGYIGTAVAEYLHNSHHTLTALARSEESAAKLRAAGIEPKTSLDAAHMADAVIHMASAPGPDMAKFDEVMVRSILKILRGSNRPFLYTSGVWVIGNTKGHVAGEMAPLRPPALVSWRPSVEKLVLSAVEDQVNGFVIRPAMVFGRGGGSIGGMVNQARTERAVSIVGNGENHWSFVHIDALAELYVRAIEQEPRGEMFLAADGPAFTVRTLAETVAAMNDASVQCIPLEQARKSMGPLADALVLDQKIMSTKAGRMLGWGPKWPSVLDEIRSGSYVSA